MLFNKIKNILRPTKQALVKRLTRLFKEDPNRYLKNVSGVIHIGANVGQERGQYDELGLDVIWVEPISATFEQLRKNIEPYEKQHAIQSLITDEVGKEYDFHIANNDGASSSILKLKHHKEIWPDVEYCDQATMYSETLASLIESREININRYQALVMDTQGSELLVLKGAVKYLPNFKYVMTEAADFEAYENCCQVADLVAFLAENGFKEISRQPFSFKSELGQYFNIVFENHRARFA